MVGAETHRVEWSVKGLKRFVKTAEPAILNDRLLTFALCAVSGLFFLLLLLPILRGKTFIAGDLLNQSLPFRKFYADCLHSHESFLWSPALYGGFYLHGEGQGGMMHPFHLLLYSVLPLTKAFGIEILSTYLFLFAGCYTLFRAWKIATPAALFGSFLFTFGGTNLTLLEHMNAIAVIAHLPWILLAIQRVFESVAARSRALWLSAVALLVGSQVLLGHPQSVYFCALIEGGYLVFLMSVKIRWARLLEVAGALALGLLIGCAQLLPTLAATKDSVRSDHLSLAFLSEMSLQPQELLQWFNPFLWKGLRYDQLRSFYDLFLYCGGAVTLLLFVWILARKDVDLPRRNLIRFLGVLAVGSLFLALGKYNLLFPLYARLPVIGMFRGPARYTVLTDFAVAAGAALALDHLRNLGGQLSLSPFARRLAALFAAISAATIVIAFLPKLTRSSLTPHLASHVMALAGGLLAIAGALLFLGSARAPRISRAALGIFVVLEVAGIQGMVLLAHNKTGNPFQVASLPPVAAPGPVEGRDGDKLVLLDYRLVDGYSGLEPASPIPIDSDVYARVTGARAVGGESWNLVPDPLPLVRLRNRAVLMANREALLADSNLIAQASLMEGPFTPPARLAEDLKQVDSFDFSTAALVEAPVALDRAAAGSLNLLEEHPGRLRLASQASGAMLATVGTRFNSGWKILIDGKAQNSLRVDGSLLGFVVPAGTHAIECGFDPDDFRRGKLASLIGILGTLLYAAVVALRR